MRKEGTKDYYYLSVDETQWKDIADLVNLIYGSIQPTADNKNEFLLLSLS